MMTLETPTLNEKQAEIAEFYARNGYYVLEDGFSPAEIAALRAETVRICAGDAGDAGDVAGVEGRTPGETDDELLRRYLCIHFPHKISPLMFEALSQPKMVAALTAMIGPNVKCMQSMLFVKAAGKPGQAWHQDEDYIPTRDRSLCGAWIAMDDATTENGCLWIIPGSHQSGVLWDQTWHADRRFNCPHESVGFPYADEDAVPVEVKAGAVVFFNGYTLHRSLPNRAKSGYRHALVNHYMSAQSLLPWMQPRPGDPQIAKLDMRDIVMVAGRDPYAHHGVEERHKPHVRAAGDGGCVSGEYED